MKARVRVDGRLLDDFDVCNGLRQDRTMAPTLFNLTSALFERDGFILWKIGSTSLTRSCFVGLIGKLRRSSEAQEAYRKAQEAPAH